MATRGSSPSTDSLPTNPRLQATYGADRRPERTYGHGEPVIAGSLNSLYIVNPGDGSSNVSRYSNGDQLWSSYVPAGVPLAVYTFADGGPLVLTGNEESLLNRTFTRLDLETGDVVWTLDFEDGEQPDVIDGRLFVETWAEDLLKAGIEYDPETGVEINRLEADFVGIEPNAIVTVNLDESYAQRYNLDFQPIGERIPLEQEYSPNFTVVAATLDQNLVYYLEGRLLIASADGETVAECALDISLVVWLTVTDDGLIIADALNELEVFTLEDGVCRAIFKREGHNRRGVVDDGYVVFDSFMGLTDRRSYEVVELATGETVATSEGQLLIANGYALKNLDGKATLIKLDDGTEVWTIDVPVDASIRVGDDLIAVVTPNDSDATVEIYADS